MTNICGGDFSVDQIRSAIVLAVGYDTADASAFLSASGEVVSKAELCGRFNDALQHVDPHAKAGFWELLTRYTSMGFWGLVGLAQYGSYFPETFQMQTMGPEERARLNLGSTSILPPAAVIALISYFIMRNRKLQQNSIKKLEEMDAKALLVASAVDDGVPSFAEELCKDAQTRTSSSEFREAVMKAAQKHGVTLKYRHFFKPDGSLRNEKDVCTMLKAVPPLRSSKTKSHTRKSSKQHHRGGKGRGKGSQRSV